MKHVRKIFAFALTLVMAFAIALPAFAEDGGQGGAASTTPVGRTIDPKVTVTGLGENDTVTAYKFITWDEADGWVLAPGITGIAITDITGPNGEKQLTAAQLGTLASQTDKMTAVTGSKNGTTWEMTCGTLATAGSYLILVSSGAAEYIYNPAVVSADFDGESGTVALTESAAAIKKQNITVEKEADNAPDDYDVQVGDIVPFTVTVTVPQYNTNWTEPYFKVTDTLSAGLTIEAVPTIAGLAAGTDYNITNGGTKGASGFTIEFTETYLKTKPSTALEIQYSAKVGEAVKDTAQVHEETNTVTIDFSNNPSDESSHKTDEKKTHHYTFAIGANRLGQNNGKTSELIKVGVDDNGTIVTAYKEGETLPTGVTPLAGAKFTLTGTGANNTGTVTLEATSGEDGSVVFNNLEVGSYTLKETKAPAGYIKDNTEHPVVISAAYNDDTTLKSYTITIDGTVTSTYTATTNAENVTVYEAPTGGNSTLPIANKQGTELPSTGGIGTTIFYVVGGVMVAGAVIFLLTKRRAAAE